MHSHALTAAVAAALLASIGAASTQDEKMKSRDARVMVVQGCIDGSRLTVHGESPAAHTDRFQLRGNKDLMKVLTKDLKGHFVEVTGVLEDPGNTQGRGKTVQVGKKTTITTGARDVPTGPAEPARDPILEVSSFKDVRKDCR
ncbi:MAG TPA: hypothetical protein VL225_03285 [Vicinamibacterales bacterium]|jgi:hypothetical protein|nr:hypothetical protein [Vicinamibacterales bacterium]